MNIEDTEALRWHSWTIFNLKNTLFSFFEQVWHIYGCHE